MFMIQVISPARSISENLPWTAFFMPLQTQIKPNVTCKQQINDTHFADFTAKSKEPPSAYCLTFDQHYIFTAMDLYLVFSCKFSLLKSSFMFANKLKARLIPKCIDSATKIRTMNGQHKKTETFSWEWSGTQRATWRNDCWQTSRPTCARCCRAGSTGRRPRRTGFPPPSGPRPGPAAWHPQGLGVSACGSADQTPEKTQHRQIKRSSGETSANSASDVRQKLEWIRTFQVLDNSLVLRMFRSELRLFRPERNP